MKTFKHLMEDVFMDKVNTVFHEKIKGHIDAKPSDFDPDALQLGVHHEMQNNKNMRKALIRAMLRLKKNPHYYDDVNDYGNVDVTPQNQVTWTGHPGQRNM